MTSPDGIGPYRDLVREKAGYYAEVFRGQDRHGKYFHVVKATDYGAVDPATRDRFANAVRAVKPELAESEPEASVPWAAFKVEDGKQQYVDWMVGLVENAAATPAAPVDAPPPVVPYEPTPYGGGSLYQRTLWARRGRAGRLTRTGNTIRIVWIALVVGLLIGANGGVLLRFHRSASPSPTPSGSVAPVPTATGNAAIDSPFLDDMPKPPPATRDAGLPESALLGQVYGPSDATEDRDLDYGFAFRLPTGWTCVDPGTTPGAVYRFCIEGDPGTAGGRVRMVQRACPNGCSAADRQKLATDWLSRWSDLPKLPAFRALDANTSYAAVLGAGKVYLVVTRYWKGHQLGVVLDGPGDREPVLRKIGDDVLTQAVG